MPNFPVLNKHLVLATTVVLTSGCQAQDVDLDSLQLPDGFSVSVYAEVPGPRQLALGANNTVFVGTNRGGSVRAIVDRNGDYEADAVVVLTEGMNAPNGVAYHAGDLYIGEINRISKIENVDDHLMAGQATVTVNDALPNRRHHGFKFLQIGPDGRLYFPVGAPCNVCEEEEIFAGIHAMDLDGSNMEKIASGIRNSVGFDWHPVTGELWFTDNGRDMLGDDLPAGEINRISNNGQHFGFPYIHQGDLPDPDFGSGHSADSYVPPVYNLNAHVAPLGMVFYQGDMFPESYTNTILVAEHGSWNRSEKSGYRVMMGKIAADNAGITEYTPFVEGWLEGQMNWGRPVDVLNMPDGSVLISDDQAGVVYRVTYSD